MKQITNLLRPLALSLMAAMIAADASAATNGINITPAEGEVTSLSEFELRFDGEWGLGTNRRGRIVVTGPEGVTIPPIMNTSMGTYYLVYFDDDAVITTPGEYTITLPAGKFDINGEDVPETTFHYTIVSGDTPGEEFPAYTFDPAPGTYTRLNRFTMTIDTDDEIVVNELLMSVEGPNGDVGTIATVENDTHSVVITPADSYGSALILTDVGAYTLRLARGAVKVGNAANEAIAVDYLVDNGTAGNWTGDVTADPEAGSELETLREIFVTFTGAGSVKVSNSAGPADFPKLYDSSDRVAATATAFASTNVLDISLNTEVHSPGAYRLVIPRNFIKVDGVTPTDDIVIAYTIVGSQSTFDYTYTLTPATGSAIGPDAAFTISFEGATLTAVENNSFAWGTDMPHFTNTMSAYNPPLMIAKDGNTFTMTHQWPFETEGSYTLVIPADYFMLTDTDGVTIGNDLIVAEYTMNLTGIEALGGDAADRVDVYNAQGVLVKRGASRDAVRNLPAGLYIVGGVKVLVR